MTRKDFELIANVLAEYRENAPELTDAMAETFATKLANRNERFNYAQFIAAAKGE